MTELEIVYKNGERNSYSSSYDESNYQIINNGVDNRVKEVKIQTVRGFQSINLCNVETVRLRIICTKPKKRVESLQVLLPLDY